MQTIAKNQVIIKGEFYSYDTLIAFTKEGQIYLTSKWDYSRTTLKYLCQFLGVKSKKDIEQGIKEGKYLL